MNSVFKLVTGCTIHQLTQLTARELRLLEGMVESEAINGMALVPLNLKPDADALIEKLQNGGGISPSETASTPAPCSPDNSTAE